MGVTLSYPRIHHNGSCTKLLCQSHLHIELFELEPELQGPWESAHRRTELLSTTPSHQSSAVQIHAFRSCTLGPEATHKVIPANQTDLSTLQLSDAFLQVRTLKEKSQTSSMEPERRLKTWYCWAAAWLQCPKVAANWTTSGLEPKSCQNRILNGRWFLSVPLVHQNLFSWAHPWS